MPSAPVFAQGDAGAALAARHPNVLTADDLVRIREIVPLYITDTALDIQKGGFSISPDQQSFAYQLRTADPATNAYVSSWFVASVSEDRPPVRVADAGEIRLNGRETNTYDGQLLPTSEAKWSPDGMQIAFIRLENGQASIWAANADGSGSKRLATMPSDIREFEWSPDGRGIFVVTNRETADAIANSRERERRSGLRWTPGDRFNWASLLQPTYTPPEPGSLYFIDERTQAISPASEQEAGIYRDLRTRPPRLHGLGRSTVSASDIGNLVPTSLRFPIGTAKPDYLAMQTGEIRAAFSVPVNGDRTVFGKSTVSVTSSNSHKIRQCSNVACTGYISDVWWRPNGSEVVFISGDRMTEEQYSVFAWNLNSGRVRRIYSTQNELSWCSMADDSLVCVYATMDHPAVVAQLDLANGRLHTLVDPNADFARYRLTPSERLTRTYRPSGSRVISELIYPRGYIPGRRYPLAIVQYKFGGFARGGQGDEFPARLFAEAGIMVLVHQPITNQLRLRPTRSRREEIRAEIDAHHEAMLAMEQVIDTLVDRGLVDRDRVAIMGLSTSAQVTIEALTRGRYRYRAAIIASGPGEPSAYFLSSIWREREAAYGTELSSRGPVGGMLDRWSLSQNLGNLRTPILFNLPDNEAIPAGQSLISLSAAHIPFDAYIYPNEYHMKWQPAHRLSIYRRNVQWLKFWLLGIQSRDPVDESQNGRWRELQVRLDGADQPH